MKPNDSIYRDRRRLVLAAIGPEDRVTASDLVDRLGLERGQIASALGCLYNRGLLNRTREIYETQSHRNQPRWRYRLAVRRGKA